MNTWDDTKACFVNGTDEAQAGITEEQCRNFSEGRNVAEWRAKGCSDKSFSDEASCLAPTTGTWVPGICSTTKISMTETTSGIGEYSNAGFRVVSPAGYFAARWAYTAPTLN